MERAKYPGVETRPCSGPCVGVGRIDSGGRDASAVVGVAVDGVVGGEGGGRLLEVGRTIIVPSARSSFVHHPAVVGVRIGGRGWLDGGWGAHPSSIRD